MICPPALEAGHQVGIVAPATQVSREDIETAIHILEEWGLEVILGPNLFKKHNQFAGTDAERTADLQAMLDNPDIHAIICARGGYGTIRVVDKLDFSTFMQKPKWVVGFSDITVLHCHLHNLGVESIHGVMPLLFPKQTQETIESLHQVLFGQPSDLQVSAHLLNRAGRAEGEMVGGNLSLFANTIGTASEIETAGKILFLEDVDEYLYHLDRMMIHLYRAGKLRDLAGLVVGQFTEIKDDAVAFGHDVNEIIAELVQEYAYPVCYDFPIGHEIHNMTVVCGRTAQLKVESQGVGLYFEGPAFKS
ncbi:MAG: LD-carboxypeptidase [Microscillaceae bacterium]|nr:LD-carboxypeptidase [Microscillaceae bacterium]